jgi:8-oxo-dGTP pyrophosphatase MutT (NUDIX family)
LITSRESRKWLIPKGWPMKGLKDHQAAAREAIEEAGIKGKVGKKPVGQYTYQKRLIDHVEPCRVFVYRLDVDKEQAKWRERDQRERRWVPVADAADLVTEPSLANLLRRFAQALVARNSRKDQKTREALASV